MFQLNSNLSQRYRYFDFFLDFFCSDSAEKKTLKLIKKRMTYVFSERANTRRNLHGFTSGLVVRLTAPRVGRSGNSRLHMSDKHEPRTFPYLNLKNLNRRRWGML